MTTVEDNFTSVWIS